ncbi:helix-turn-helix transcriptional regulator [Curtobacterium sp. ISL-83]|uniref:helix-turn-helix transcriptional regulator n=1 Tax=Curtobacterium sp. ISL-83 TaxID=2819145 RepID=UPI001BE99D01|nr:helix-turn-helix transcriptional regulator [Curtobacterium sp. ISL-83]MBT2502755.1 helix-turn-helix transcriptional regulator [Curtobacterium sp. ISL-83]
MTETTPPFEYRTGGDESLSIHRIATGGRERTGTIGPRPDHVVFWLADGHAELSSDRGERWHVPAGAPVMLSAPVAYAFRTDADRMTLLHITPALLGETDEPSEFVQPDPDDVRLEPLRTLLREVVDRVLDPDLPVPERRALNRRVATVVLSTFTPTRPDVEDRLRCAIRFVHEHAGDPITVVDIGAAAGLSERGLQDLFRRRLAVTPMQYLREVRLDRVHAVLSAPGPDVVTVREVAWRWQLAHLGRFAAAYRARFGEGPSQTLTRGGRPAGPDDF